MSIAEKLIKIAENEPKVYEAGKISQIQGVEPAEVDASLFGGKLKTIAENTIRVFEKGRADANLQKATASGEFVRVDDVSPIEHKLKVDLTSDTLTDFSGVGVTRYGKNLLELKDRVERNFGAGSKETVRNFTENSIYKGVAANNFYYGNNDFNNYSVNENSVTVNMKSWNGYGLGLNVQVKPNTQYTFSFANYDKSQHSPAFSIYDEQGIWKQLVEITAGNCTFTTPAEAYWLMIIFRPANGGINTDIVFRNPQLELGSTATEYEPYKEPQMAFALADGTVNGLTSLSPTMTLIPDTSGVNINLEYYKDK